MRIVEIVIAAAIPFVLLGCPDSKANPDPAATAKDGGAAATTPAPAASTGNKEGGGW